LTHKAFPPYTIHIRFPIKREKGNHLTESSFVDEVKDLSHHFDRTASKYAECRDTDPDVIEPIIQHLPRHRRSLDVLDVGCGTGRYTNIITQRFKRRLGLVCCDYSSAMLVECRKRMGRQFASKRVHYCRLSADDLPFPDESADGVVSFNAVHHFKLHHFVGEASRVLRPRGLLAIYTRTLDQNQRTVWGQHFPGFTEQETRLYSCERLKQSVDDAAGLKMEGIHEFKHKRVESVESLLNRARALHYSTFALYARNEFVRALDTFAQRLSRLCQGGLIEHAAENILILARRT
jgi:ubiquinone/menaquinone biosynthesis C-methylase UbiE